MNLSYRGTAYQPVSPAVDVDVNETEQTGIFLGNRFTIHQTAVAHRSSTAILKYRGTTYTA